MTQLGLLQDVIPDNIRDEVSNRLYCFFDVAPVLFNFRPNKLHDGVSTFLTSLHEKSGSHFVDQTAQGFDLAVLLLILDSEDCFL